MIPKNKRRITITLPKDTYEALLACSKEGKMNKSKYIELSLNQCLNWKLIKKENKYDKSKK